MGKPAPPETSLLFVGTLYRKKQYFLEAKEKLQKQFGEPLMESPCLPWDYTDYYRNELGWPITRTFLFFRDTINPGDLADIKLTTHEIEYQLSEHGKRNVNLDPGYLTRSKVVLASTKNYSHRIYIGKGIYAEVTLIYNKGKYRPHLFTYRDYASDIVTEIFEQARAFLKTAESVHRCK
ncbi:MAG TPA: DUF4416 domain-containing protein [Nitrospiraceae bacterium]|jgi:hypothetical protein|nr:DUF4416 domain-containing protein [Nitrospiraceae bacterium]